MPSDEDLSDRSMDSISSDISMDSISSDEVELLIAEAKHHSGLPCAPLSSAPIVLTARNVLLWQEQFLSTSALQTTAVNRWTRDLKGFFFCHLPENVSKQIIRGVIGC